MLQLLGCLSPQKSIFTKKRTGFRSPRVCARPRPRARPAQEPGKRPKSHQEAPRAPQEAPREAQRASREPQEGPKRRQEAPRGAKTRPGAIFKRFWSHFGPPGTPQNLQKQKIILRCTQPFIVEGVEKWVSTKHRSHSSLPKECLKVSRALAWALSWRYRIKGRR